jgi:hypothetical protein
MGCLNHNAFAALQESRIGPSSPNSGSGKARQLYLGISDLDFLPDLNGIVNLDAMVANGAVDLRVAQYELDRI